jgi:hypothetical protein
MAEIGFVNLFSIPITDKTDNCNHRAPLCWQVGCILSPIGNGTRMSEEMLNDKSLQGY